MRTSMKACFYVLLPLIAGGCYRYVPATSPEAGRLIRAELNEQGAAAVTSRLGPGVLELDGLLLSNEGQELSVLVESYVTRLQGTLSAGNEPIRVPVGHVNTVLERRIDTTRSVLFGVAFAGAAFATFKLFGPGGIVFRDPDDEEEGPVQLVVPIPLNGVVWLFGGARSP